MAMPQVPSLILGSASPRRADYLKQLGVSFEVHPVDYDESFEQADKQSAQETVALLVESKLKQLRAVLPKGHRPCLVADTVVVLDDQILGKPTSSQDAVRTLQSMSGRAHEVITGVVIGDEHRHSVCCVTTQVFFRPITDGEVVAYVSTGEPLDKAGSYGLQGLGGAFVSHIHGSVSAVVGLPLSETLVLLNEWGLSHALQRG